MPPRGVKKGSKRERQYEHIKDSERRSGASFKRVIMAAKDAYPEYRKWAAYACQSGRAFRETLTRMGFYYDRAIQPQIALIRHKRDHVVFSTDKTRSLRAAAGPFDAELATLIERLLDSTPRGTGLPYKVFLLSPSDDGRRLRLGRPIKNTTKDHKGKYCSWTVGPRYTLSGALRQSPDTTVELEKLGG